MCVIVDTNTFSPVFEAKNVKHAEFSPVLEWVLHGKGKFVIGGSKYMKELEKARRFLKLFATLAKYKTGKIVRLKDADVDKEQERIEKMITDPDFDDPHLPAMVIVSKCQIICSVDTRSVRFVTDSQLYPKGTKVPCYYTGSRNKDLLCDKYVDDRYKPLQKIPKTQAEEIEEHLGEMLENSK